MYDAMVLDNPALSFVIGCARDVIDMPGLRPWPPFSGAALAFLDDLSQILRASHLADVAAFGFWCRRNALLKAKNRYEGPRLGKGLAFHSTPSNVPLNFAFSWAASLIAGNANIVRLPRRSFEQEKIICDAIRTIVPRHSDIAHYNVMLRYASDSALNDYFSSLCDVRVVWGGDQSVQNMRRSPLRPDSSEIVFPDRFSILIMHADNYLRADNKEAIARSFYNDTYLLDQNACSSPSLIVWLGEEKERAKAEFWQKAREFITQLYDLQPIQVTGKVEAFCNAAAHGLPVHIVDSRDWLSTRIKVGRLEGGLMSHRCHSGFFFEYDAENLDDIYPICGCGCQTAVYYGFSKQELGDFIMRSRPKGIMRLVPLGRALEFSLVWDGMDLIEELSRRIEIC